ncbi:hypothetical protein Hanom_Chr17g01583001 [Helianthus anomalus]
MSLIRRIFVLLFVGAFVPFLPNFSSAFNLFVEIPQPTFPFIIVPYACFLKL